MDSDPVVAGVDHVLVRVDRHEPLYSILTGAFDLPSPWPLASHPAFASAGVSFGNVDVELVRFGPTFGRTGGANARLYGIAFAPDGDLRTSERRLAARNVRHSGVVPYVRRGWDGTLDHLWNAVYLGGLLDDNLWQRGVFALLRALPESFAKSRPSGARGDVVALLDRAFPNGMAFLVEYEPAFSEAFEREESRRALRERGGGPLGVEGLAEIVVGVENFERTRRRWTRLLAPAEERERGVWRLPGGGPAIRLVPRRKSGVEALVVAVADLATAAAFLEERGLSGGVEDGVGRVDAGSLGIDLRLVERSEA
ncbi:hypothetical protein [Halegenticoccus soli]|uniref:hypothetical protein n=1 Tax=Halegenticoccus soli TaxID=1985678 RepID=UPI000C6EDB4E|nr:hypothetical protein [Halegenticoccus soli]